MTRLALGALSTLLAVSVALAGCGGDDSSGDGSASTVGARAPQASPETDTKIRIVRRAGRNRSGNLEDGATLRPRDRVHIVTRVRNAEAAAGGSVEIRLPTGPSETLRVTSGSAGDSSSGDSARIRAQRGRIALNDIRYVCQMPPRTFCPGEMVERTDDGFVLRFPVPPEDVPIVLVAEVPQRP